MKENIIKRIEELLATEDFSSIKSEMRSLQQDYRRLSEDMEDLALKNHLEAGGLMSDFHPEKDALDEKFKELYSSYTTQRKAHEIAEKAASVVQIQKKTDLVQRMTDLATNVKSIESGFEKIKKIQEEWKESGSFYNAEVKKLRFDFNHQRDIFFYKMQINKDLRSEHYKRNLEAKNEITAQIKELRSEANPSTRAQKLRDLQREWFNIGPVEYNIKDEVYADFNQTGNIIYDELKGHFQAKEKEQTENLKKKIEVCDKLKDLNENSYSTREEWDKATDQVLAFQGEWKEIGHSTKSQTVWSVFRGLMDTFYEKRRGYYKEIDGVRKENTVKKQALVEKADTVKLSTEWKETTKFLIGLQKEWKEIGPAQRGRENKLWKKFREACDTFFEAKKENFKEQDAEHKVNLEKKNALIEEVSAFQLSGEVQKDMASLKEFHKRYAGIGFVPMKDKDRNYNTFKSALDKQYDKLRVDKAERFKSEYSGKLEGMRGASNADALINDEQRFIRNKISYLKEDIANYEANLGLFGKSNNGKENPLRAQVEKSISKLRREIDEWNSKLTLLKAKSEKPVSEES